MRLRARKDANHNAIAEALLKIGCNVLDLSPMGKGVPDLLVTKPGEQLGILVEIKDGDKCKSKRKLTPAQVKFHARWRATILVVESVDEALAIFGAR